jgi:ketosteroid isomerase-like protein
MKFIIGALTMILAATPSNSFNVPTPDEAAIKTIGDVEIIYTGRQYKQQYGGLFHVVDGKIELFREYYDPIVFKDAFGLDKGEISNALEK